MQDWQWFCQSLITGHLEGRLAAVEAFAPGTARSTSKRKIIGHTHLSSQCDNISCSLWDKSRGTSSLAQKVQYYQPHNNKKFIAYLQDDFIFRLC